MKKKFNNLPIILSVLALVFSLWNFFYNHELSGGQLSAAINEESIITLSRDDQNQVLVNFSFPFENIGKQPIEIKNISYGTISISKNSSFEIFDTDSIMSILYPGNKFYYATALSLKNNDFPSLTNDEIANNLSDTIAKQVILLNVDYEIKTNIWPLINRKRQLKLHLLYEGKDLFAYLTRSDLEKIKDRIPKEFLEI